MMERIDCGLEVKFATSDGDGTFSGYGAVFGNMDATGDVIERGAFKDTLREWEARGKLPPMLLQHGGFLGGAEDMLPIGRWTEMEENSKGLKVEGELFARSTERGQYIYEGLKSGALDGLSIGYKAKKFSLRTKPDEPRRKLEAVELKEVSIVTFPANLKARVGAVKSLLSGLDGKEWRELETALRDEGLSRGDAAKAVSGLKAYLQRDAEVPMNAPRDEGAAAELVAALKRAAERIRA